MLGIFRRQNTQAASLDPAAAQRAREQALYEALQKVGANGSFKKGELLPFDARTVRRAAIPALNHSEKPQEVFDTVESFLNGLNVKDGYSREGRKNLLDELRGIVNSRKLLLEAKKVLCAPQASPMPPRAEPGVQADGFDGPDFAH